MDKIRQPIVTVCGHVDHGKTSILDSLRSTNIQSGEAGGITQKISFSLYPIDKLKQSCPLIEKSGIKLNIPGFLFIDTPGHAAFTSLRKRGGSLADLAILVIDINDGIKPQTAEVIQILKKHKTPFIIALNKVDNISGWRIPQNSAQRDTPGGAKEKSLKENIESQKQNVKMLFNERYMTIIGALNSYGFDADLFYNVEDFSQKIAMVPTSAKTREGISELIMMICGLSQKYLEKNLKLNEKPKGIMLEIKNEKSIPYIEAILHDGELNRSDTIAIANLNGDPIISKIRVLEEIKPLSTKFESKQKTQASTGLRMQLSDKEKILPGMPFVKFENNLEEIKKEFQDEINESLETSKKGIIAKADSLGSLEALLVLLKEKNIPVVKTGIGKINKTDVISAKANLEIDELDAIIVGFNVEIEEGIIEPKSKIKIITNEVVYKLIEDLGLFREEKRKDIEKKRLMGLTTICKLEILHQYVFRQTKPAIFGVKVEGGKLIANLNMIDDQDEKVGKIKNIQADQKPVPEAFEGMELAISIPGINFDRQLKEKKFLYNQLGESQFKNFKKNKDLLSQKEIKILQEIAEIKRREKPEWGM